MPDGSDTAALSLTNRAVRVRQSDPAQARELLGRALAEDVKYEPAWRWLAELVTDDGERRYCLDKAYAIARDPDTRRARAALGAGPTRPPAEVVLLAKPERPDASGVRKPAGRGRGWVPWAGAAAVVLMLVTGLGFALASGSRSGEPVHVALVAGMTGESATTSAHMERSLRMHTDIINEAGGINGHPVELLVYDDADQPDRARGIAEQIVRENKVMYVIGHGVSDTALAAAPIYQKAKIPAITPSATSSQITDGSDWYFRSMFGNRTQSDFLAAYGAKVLGSDTAAIVYGDNESGRSGRETFVASFRTFGAVAAELPVSYEPERSAATVDAAVQRLRTLAPGVPIVLAVREKLGLEIITKLRTAGVTAPVLGTDSLASRAFHDLLIAREQAQGLQGKLTPGLYMGTPMAQDSLSGPALAWAHEFERRYGERPLWHAATARQALNIGLHLMRDNGYGLDDNHKAEDRQRLRDALGGLKDRKNAFQALLGPLYFTENGSAQMPVSIVTSDGTKFVSAPVQLTIYEPLSEAALRADTAGGHVITIGNRHLTRRQVVATGINLNEVRDVDTRDGTYYMDFFLWLKYVGDHAASDVQFINAVKPDLKLGTPLRDVTENGVTYRLYRVADRFRSSFDFRDFPFDHQRLSAVLQNRTRTSEQVVYATDKEILNQKPDDYLRSGADASRDINQAPNWLARSARFFQQTVGSSDALGDPKAVGATSGIFYSQYAAEVVITRDVLPFLFKNLLPLALLICVTYLSLFFKPSESAAPVSMGVTAILSTAVLLNNVTSQLPSVSYTVALEWGYYAFILLAACCVLIAMVRKGLANVRRDDAERALANSARIGYPVYVLGIVCVYLASFA
ncbi:ABC transporter substrate-binding protein [Lentzea guizhouensis]|uniref:ABC transporter substrate-binding protein n=1 Tax=Lentzea guizhouensis TaxID=1586287 RepID=UPI0014766EFF|nr:ABC transporter substrate-binding protein [Lentzea guizhouensis]